TSKPQSKPDVTIANKILKVLAQENLSSRQLLLAINCTESQLIESLKVLIETRKIKITEANTYTLL
ncbi:MAG: recombinase RecQ, partial [Flavobacteriaceae bacterium]|nr:recombinase RecQ [Flavobacteriaceae bacterium]